MWEGVLPYTLYYHAKNKEQRRVNEWAVWKLSKLFWGTGQYLVMANSEPKVTEADCSGINNSKTASTASDAKDIFIWKTIVVT